MGKMLLWAGFFLLLHVQLGSTYKLVCYFTNWAQYRPEPAKYMPANIDPQLCTHLVYAFAIINENKIATKEKNDDVLYKQFNDLKQKNPKLVTLLAVGGWNFEIQKFTAIVASADNRKVFIKSVIAHLRKYNFDGIDLDIEFPGSNNSPPEDKERFTILIEEMLAAFIAEAASENAPRLLVTAAVSAGKGIIDAGYEIAKIGKILDHIGVMTYDFHGAWEAQSGHNSPLYQGSTEKGDSNLTSYFAMNYWKQNGAPAEKLLMGFPTYGRTFKISNSNLCDVGIPVSGAGSAGPYTGENGFRAYYEICTWLNGTAVKWIPDQSVPYACKDNEWVGFDNKESYECKAQFLRDGGFGGAIVWTLDFDDFLGTFCNEGQYPLIAKLKSLLEGAPISCPGGTVCPGNTGGSPTLTIDAVSSTTQATKKPSATSPPVAPANDVDLNFCIQKPDGNYEDPLNPNRFYVCSSGMTYSKQCSSGLVFRKSCNCCDWP